MAQSDSDIPNYSLSEDYFDELLTVSLKNECLQEEEEAITKDLQFLWKQIQKYEKKLYGKKQRRKDSQLKKFFSCPHANCPKSYSSKSSLVTHVKLKHNKL